MRWKQVIFSVWRRVHSFTLLTTDRKWQIRDKLSKKADGMQWQNLNMNHCAELASASYPSEVQTRLCGSADLCVFFGPADMMFRNQDLASSACCSPCSLCKTCTDRSGPSCSRALGCSYDPSRHQGFSSPDERGTSWTWWRLHRWRWKGGSAAKNRGQVEFLLSKEEQLTGDLDQ